MATPIPGNRAALSAWDVVAMDGQLAHVRGEGARARGVVIDSRAVTPGCAFVALRGDSHDGHAFLGAAVDAGASLIVTEQAHATARADVVVVADSLEALGDIARAHLARWRRGREGLDPARTIVISGSAGKTTTKQIAGALAATLGEACVTAGNLNNRIGLPMVALTVEPRHRFAVLEAGMSLRGEIQALARIAAPDVAVITNIGVAHAEGVGGGRADVAREKGALLASLAPSGAAVVCADDAAAMGQLVRSRATTVRLFGRADGSDYRLLSLASRGFDGARITFDRPCRACASPRAKETLEVDSPLLGEAAAIDFLAALAAVEAACGAAIDPVLIAAAMATLANAGQRGDVIHLADGVVIIDDTYNANPHSVRASLALLGDVARSEGRRAVAVLGEMKELGESSRDEHVALGEVAARAGVSLMIGCGGLIDGALEAARAAGVAVRSAADVSAAAAFAQADVARGDVVLVKASRSVGAERIVAALVAARGKVV